MKIIHQGPIDLILPGHLAYEWVAIESACNIASRMGFAPDRIEDIKTVVSEAFLNAIEHGNRGREGRKVTIRFVLEADSLRIDIQDKGRGFDPSRIPEPHLEQKMKHREDPGGWGLFLMRRLVDRFEVHRRFPFGCCLSLTMQLKPDSHE